MRLFQGILIPPNEARKILLRSGEATECVHFFTRSILAGCKPINETINSAVTWKYAI